MSLVSIIIPAYNAALYLPTTVASVLNQTYTDWECLIIDDGSDDETASIARAFAGNDTRIKYHYKNNGGLSSARNYGLAKACGNYIQFLDADDVLFPDKLKLMVNAYDAMGENAMVLFSDYIYGQSDDPYKECNTEHKLFKQYAADTSFDLQKIYKYWDVKITIPVHCFLFPGAAIQQIFFDEKLKSKEDWNFHLEVLSRGIKYVPYNYVGCSYRSSENSMSRNQSVMILSSIYVLHKWKYSNWPYSYRVAYYFCQVLLMKLKGEKVDTKKILQLLKEFHGTYAYVLVVFCLMLIPIALMQKGYNFIRIRL